MKNLSRIGSNCTNEKINKNFPKSYCFNYVPKYKCTISLIRLVHTVNFPKNFINLNFLLFSNRIGRHGGACNASPLPLVSSLALRSASICRSNVGERKRRKKDATIRGTGLKNIIDFPLLSNRAATAPSATRTPARRNEHVYEPRRT